MLQYERGRPRAAGACSSAKKALEAPRSTIDEGMRSGEHVDGVKALARVRRKHRLRKPGG